MVQSFRFAIVPLRQSLFYGGWNPTTTGILMIVGEIARLIELQSWRITSTLIVGKYDFWLRDYDNPNILASISLYKSSPNCWNIWVFLWSPSSWTVMFNWLHPTIVIRFESLYIIYVHAYMIYIYIQGLGLRWFWIALTIPLEAIPEGVSFAVHPRAFVALLFHAWSRWWHFALFELCRFWASRHLHCWLCTCSHTSWRFITAFVPFLVYVFGL